MARRRLAMLEFLLVGLSLFSLLFALIESFLFG